MPGFRTFWVETLAVPTLKRFLQVEERKRAALGTPSNPKPDGEGPQGTEGWGSQVGLQLDGQGQAVLHVVVEHTPKYQGGSSNSRRRPGCSEEVC